MVSLGVSIKQNCNSLCSELFSAVFSVSRSELSILLGRIFERPCHFRWHACERRSRNSKRHRPPFHGTLQSKSLKFVTSGYFWLLLGSLALVSPAKEQERIGDFMDFAAQGKWEAMEAMLRSSSIQWNRFDFETCSAPENILLGFVWIYLLYGPF